MSLGSRPRLFIATGLTLGLAVSCGRNAQMPAAQAAGEASAAAGADLASGPAKAPWGLVYPADPAVFGKGVAIDRKSVV